MIDSATHTRQNKQPCNWSHDTVVPKIADSDLIASMAACAMHFHVSCNVPACILHDKHQRQHVFCFLAFDEHEVVVLDARFLESIADI